MPIVRGAGVKLAELLERCRALTGSQPIAAAVVDILGESLPCGYETPEASNFGGVPHVTAAAFVGSPSDARAYAAAIVRAADELDGGAA